MAKRCKDTMDLLDPEMNGMNSKIKTKNKDNKMKEETKVEGDTIDWVDTIDNKTDKPEINKLVQKAIFNTSTQYNSEEEFIADEDIYSDRFIAFKKEGNNISVLSILKEDIEELNLSGIADFHFIKENLPDFHIFPQKIKEDEETTVHKNEIILDRFKKSIAPKNKIDPDKILESIQPANINLEDDYQLSSKSKKNKLN